MNTQSDGKETILSRIREALTITGDSHDTADVPPVVADCLPAVGASFDERVAQFSSNAANLAASFHHCSNRSEAISILRSISEEEAWRFVALHSSPIIEEFANGIGNGVSFFLTDTPYDKASLEKCDAALTTCECLVAQTGSVMVSSVATGGRALSVLPPHHIVIATQDQMQPDLAAAYALVRQKYGDKIPSMISFITGPSRTGDIERILVLGVHGPRRLTIILVP